MNRTIINVMLVAFGLVLGSLLGGWYIYDRFNTQYVKLHNTNIGYFAFKDSKIYSLEEMKNFYQNGK